VLKPLESIDLRGTRRGLPRKYRGILGKATEEEIEELLAKAEWGISIGEYVFVDPNIFI